MNLGLNTVSQTDTCFSLNTDSSTVRRLSLLRYNYQTMSSATFCQLARSWRKRFHFQHSCTRPLPPDMVHCRRLPSPHSIMTLHAASKPNKLPTLRNLWSLSCWMSPLDKQIYTAALFHGLSLSGISFPPPRPGLRFTTRKTTTSGSPFSRTMHVIPNDTLDDAIKNSPDFDVRP